MFNIKLTFYLMQPCFQAPNKYIHALPIRHNRVDMCVLKLCYVNVVLRYDTTVYAHKSKESVNT